jgi:signal transduction histidine kinase
MTPRSDAEEAAADSRKDGTRYIQNAIEMALSLGDFQKEIQSECTPQMIASETIERLCKLIQFKASAICLVEEETSDMQLSVCVPVSAKRDLEAELDFMIQNGFVAWAIRERRGITVYSKDTHNQVLLHVMATYSRIRGLFMGILPTHSKTIPNASLEIASLILRNAANGIESLYYSAMLQQQKQDLKEAVNQQTQRIVNYEKQLLQAQKTEAIAALAGGVAHQFNNALTGLIGNIDLISMIVSQESKIRPYLERTRPIIKRMSTLTDQLLAYARGGTFIVNQTMLFKDLLNEILPGIKNAIKETVTLSVDITDRAVSVNVDLIQMRTAILAIVSNANEAIGDEGTIQIQSRISKWNQIPEALSHELKPGEYASICIQDSGEGMDETTLRRLFEPFFSTKFEGRGLSMAAVSGIIKSHGGGITAESNLGSGTQVTIFLPLVAAG